MISSDILQFLLIKLHAANKKKELNRVIVKKNIKHAYARQFLGVKIR